MPLSESKKRKPWILFVLVIGVVSVLALGFCHFGPTPKTTQKTIVFEAD